MLSKERKSLMNILFQSFLPLCFDNYLSDFNNFSFRRINYIFRNNLDHNKRIIITNVTPEKNGKYWPHKSVIPLRYFFLRN